MTIEEGKQRIEYWLGTFGQNITRIDHAIDLLQDLKEELNTENVNLNTIGIDAYVYGSLSSLKLLKKDLYEDIEIIKTQLSLLINDEKRITNFEALELLHQEFKNNWLNFFEAISIEPGYYQTFEELLKALELEMDIPYGDLKYHEKAFLRGWDKIYSKACAEADRRKHGANPNSNWFEQ
ncbi:hypothetical protein [Nostoc sp.]|uniref:hypothetical protein n=1 Tax=Nostoc sp. TaxID=1180 RepID=UPI002FFB451A